MAQPAGRIRPRTVAEAEFGTRRRRRHPAADHDLVTIGQAAALGAVGQPERHRPATSELEQATQLIVASGPDTVPDANRSPGRTDAPLTVMCASICAGVQYIVENGGRVICAPLISTRSSMSRPHGSAVGVVEVGQQCDVARGRRDPRVVERVERHDPRRHRGRERLAEERAERHRLPGLDVARRPVVDQAHPEDVLAGLVERAPARRASVARTEHEARPRPRSRGVATARTSARRRHGPVRTAGTISVRRHDDRAGPAVVADRQVLPVRRQRVAVRAEQPADVGRVVLGGVEVDVVGDRERQAAACSPSSGCRCGSIVCRCASSTSHERTAPRSSRQVSGPVASSGLSTGPATSGARSGRSAAQADDRSSAESPIRTTSGRHAVEDGRTVGQVVHAERMLRADPGNPRCSHAVPCGPRPDHDQA